MENQQLELHVELDYTWSVRHFWRDAE